MLGLEVRFPLECKVSSPLGNNLQRSEKEDKHVRPSQTDLPYSYVRSRNYWGLAAYSHKQGR